MASTNGTPKVAPFTVPTISQHQQVSYLIGYPIAHSASPKMHDTIAATTSNPYAQVLIETTEFEKAMSYLRNHVQLPRLLGSGVTMPYKVAAMAHVDELTPEGQAVGAVNTIFLQSDPSTGQQRFIGHNTDTIGIRDAFLNNVSPSQMQASRGKPGLIIGGGGTCRAAVYALQTFLGLSPIYVINRDKSEVDAVLKECEARGAARDLVHVASVQQAQSLEAPALVVSAVPDFPPTTDGERAVREILAHFTKQMGRGALLEMCYHPSPDTGITRLATEHGWQVIGGIEAMVGQGLEQSKLWAGTKVDENVRVAARAAALRRH